MTGRVVYQPTNTHYCVVSFRYGDNGRGHLAWDHPAYWARPGTVLECDCGLTFVAQQPQDDEMFPRWRRESRFARWRRERPQRREAARNRPYEVVEVCGKRMPNVPPPTARATPPPPPGCGQGSDDPEAE